MDTKFYSYERHVVTTTSEETDGLVSVRWVMLSPTLTGKAKRGQHPKFAKPVKAADLVEITDATVIASAQAALAAPPKAPKAVVAPEAPAASPDVCEVPAGAVDVAGVPSN